MFPSVVESLYGAVSLFEIIGPARSAGGTVASRLIGKRGYFVIKLPADNVFVIAEFFCHLINDLGAEITEGLVCRAAITARAVSCVSSRIFSHNLGIFMLHPRGGSCRGGTHNDRDAASLTFIYYLSEERKVVFALLGLHRTPGKFSDSDGIKTVRNKSVKVGVDLLARPGLGVICCT